MKFREIKPIENNTDITGHFLIKNLGNFIEEKLVPSPQKDVMELLVKEVTKLFNQHMANKDVIQYWEDQKNYEPNGDLKVEDKNVPKFFGGTKKEYDPKIVFDPNCLGNHWEILR